MHKFFILIFPRFSVNPANNQNVVEVSVKVFLYRQDSSNNSGWRLVTTRTSAYARTSGRIHIGAQVSDDANQTGSLVPVSIKIDLREWVQYNQFYPSNQITTELEVLISAKNTSLGPFVDVESIACNNTVHATVTSAL